MVGRLLACVCSAFASMTSVFIIYALMNDGQPWLGVWCGIFVLAALAASVLFLFSRSDRYDSAGVALTCGLAFLILPLLVSIPLYLSGAVGSWLEAYLDALSCLTTTGTRFISSSYELPAIYLLYRALLQVIGLLVSVRFFLALAGLAPSYNVIYQMQGRAFFPAQSSLSQIIRLALLAGSPFLLAILVCWGLLIWAGSDSFWALYYASLAVATGGDIASSPGNAIFALPWVSIILAGFIFFSTISVRLHLVYARQIRAGQGMLPYNYFHNKEFLTWLVWLTLGSLLVTIYLWKQGITFQQLPNALFAMLSFAATSGLGPTLPPSLITPFFLLLCLWMAFVGGSTLSASGGAKIERLRHMLHAVTIEADYQIELVKSTKASLAHSARPFNAAWMVFGTFIAGGILLCTLLTLTGVDFQTAILSSTFSLTNTGGLHLLDVDILNFSATAKVLLGAGMFLGRLELVAVFALFYRQ